MSDHLQVIIADLSQLPRTFAPEVSAGRVETGPLQINDDWPATFVRGDHSFYYAMQLDTVIDIINSKIDSNILGTSDIMAIKSLDNLSKLLKSCKIKFDKNNINELHDINDHARC